MQQVNSKKSQILPTPSHLAPSFEVTPFEFIDKKFELMLTRRAKTYSSSSSQTVSLSPAFSSQFIFTRESRMLRASLPSSGRPSVCLTHSWSVSKRCKLGSRNFHCGCPKVSSLSWQNFVPLGVGVTLERGRQRGVPPKKMSLCRYWLE